MSRLAVLPSKKVMRNRRADCHIAYMYWCCTVAEMRKSCRLHNMQCMFCVVTTVRGIFATACCWNWAASVLVAHSVHNPLSVETNRVIQAIQVFWVTIGPAGWVQRARLYKYLGCFTLPLLIVRGLQVAIPILGGHLNVLSLLDFKWPVVYSCNCCHWDSLQWQRCT